MRDLNVFVVLQCNAVSFVLKLNVFLSSLGALAVPVQTNQREASREIIKSSPQRPLYNYRRSLYKILTYGILYIGLFYIYSYPSYASKSIGNIATL